MLKISHIKKSFNNRAVLRDVSFEANNGFLTILEGENGAGKSTLFSILSGTLKEDEGSLELDAMDISNMPALSRSSLLAILKQDPMASSSPALTIMENCALADLKKRRARFKIALRTDVKEHILRHLEALELNFDEAMLNRLMGELSGGQRQIYAFAMATINKPKLLLLDEPTAALDEKSTHLLMRLIKKLITEWQIPAIMISHDHTLNERYGDAIFVLKDGVIAIEG
ncbi:MAG TPA: ATP-binding cassette domain-containing protein [Myxococcota bacterium]|nr:ATP-binding cassette domain-containing protein [Myxococcota bacterium]